ncbi:MAG: thiamine pyrophosphate-binding protein [Promethearchaeota archaeon]|nr:MAG: thiamine pyrophosphate-binding protein [Candidatus Lokiarchaeota archaeon]
MMIKVIEAVADILKQAGIEYIFGLPGGVIPFLFEEIYKQGQINCIVTRHEAAAAVMADMYGRLTRKPSVLMGQGIWIATNGGFGIVEAFLAGVPMVIITELSDWYGVNQRAPYQVGTGEYGSVNLPNIFRSMTKYTTVAMKPEEIIYGVQLAIKHAISGRPGPTCVLIRWKALMETIDPAKVPEPLFPTDGYLRVSPPCISSNDAEKVADMLITAKNPVMIAGRGVHASGAYKELQTLAELIGMPVTTSYLGKGSIAETHALAMGAMASLGQPVANKMIRRSDLLLAIGTGLAPENTYNCSQDYINPLTQKIVHIDIDPRNTGWTYPVTLGITSDARLALNEIIRAVKKKNPAIDFQGRMAELEALKENPANEFFTNKYYNSDNVPIEPERIVKEINELIREDDIIVLDGGNNRMWFTRLFQSKRAGQLIGPGGAAGMAWCASAAICAQLLNPNRKVIGIIGDGGLLMALYALEMVKQYNLSLIYVVFNNSSFGNVRDYMTRKGRALTEYEETNFAAIANTMGIEGLRIESPQEFRPALEKALASNKPTLLDVVVSRASSLRIRVELEK